MKIKALIIAILTFFGVAFYASPASATNYQWLEQHCHNIGGNHFSGAGYTVTVCATWGYRTQDDGTGIRVEDFWLDINNGCGDLESSPKTKANYQETYATDGSPVGIADYVNQGDFYNCHIYRDMELKGTDVGASDVHYQYTLNINNGSNREDNFYPTMCVGGGC